jgi:hypothetical protein
MKDASLFSAADLAFVRGHFPALTDEWSLFD